MHLRPRSIGAFRNLKELTLCFPKEFESAAAAPAPAPQRDVIEITGALRERQGW